MYSEIHSYKEIKSKILEAIDEFSEPIIRTLTPMGQNIICQTSDGMGYFVTNDGVTIAKQISFEDPIKDAIAQFIKHASLKTNYEVGDGTSTTVLLTKHLIKEGFKLIDSGWQPMELVKELENTSKQIIENIEKQKFEIKTDTDLEHIARVASSNNEEITQNTVIAIKSAGLDGHIIIEDNPKTETEVKIEEGFLIENGMFSPHLSTIQGKVRAQYEDVRVLITDKRIYYPEEALAILKTLFDKGVKDIVIVAKDFIGTAPNTFITNHIRGNMRILLIKAEEETLEDLASYLGTEVISETKGRLLNKLTIEDFVSIKKIVSDAKKTIILNQSKQASDKIEWLKEEIEKQKDDKEKEKLEKRLARMTSGTVTIMVGGRTAPEVREKMFKYEDAISAVKASMKSGYVVGGGLSLAKAFVGISGNLDILNLFKKVCISSLEQIAINCNLHFPTLLQKVFEDNGKELMGMKVIDGHIGYNAIKNDYSSLLEDGIIEPVSVVKSTLNNALSVANIILSSNFIIHLIPEQKDEQPK